MVSGLGFGLMTHDFLDVIVSREGRYGSRHITPKKKEALNLFLRCYILGSRSMEVLGRGYQEGQLGPYGVFRKEGVLVLMMMVVWGSVLGPHLCKRQDLHVLGYCVLLASKSDKSRTWLSLGIRFPIFCLAKVLVLL